MEPSPYKFNETNPRLVENAARSPAVIYGAGIIWVASVFLYNKRFFRKDGNVLNLLAFTAASLPASHVYSSLVFSSPVKEAGIINNERELQH
jgi:hypothetical protein